MPILGTGFGIEKFGDINTNPSGNNTPLYFSNCATPSALPSCTYSNGTGGVGATLTATSNGALTTTYTDGVAVSVGLIILVWKQSSALQNGLYEITQIGTGSTPWILTRLGVYDSTAEIYPSQVNVIGGSTYANLYFLEQTASPTIGSSSIVYQTATAPTGTTINQNLRLVDTYTTSALPTCTYTPNASAVTPGLNAYLNATSNGAFPTLNGVAPFQYMKVLVSGQADQTQNGDYILMNVGSASSTWRLTRISYTSSALYPAWWGIYSGTGKGLIFEQTTSTLTTANIGVSGNIVFVQVSSSGLTYFTEAQSTSAPNTTTYVDSLTAVGGATNVDFAIVPKGAGAFQLAIPDNLTSGGNKRGANSVDLQTFRGNASQVASGSYSVVIGSSNTASSSLSYCIGSANISSNTFSVAIGYTNTSNGYASSAMGGYNNIASGQYSFVGGGHSNTASGSYALALGYQNIASSQSSTSIGYANNSSNSGATGIGWGNTASGGYSSCIGYVNSTTNTYAFALGNNNSVTAISSFGLGSNNTVSGGNGAGGIGYYNVTSGGTAFGIGLGNYADGDYSICLGARAKAFGVQGRICHMADYITTQGEFQTSEFILGKRTTDATQTTLSVNFGVASAINQVVLQNNNVFRFKGQIVGKQSGSTNVGVWDIDGVIVRGANAGTTTLVINNVTLVTNASGWGTPILSADTTIGCLKVEVIGLAATNIHWMCSIKTTEAIYS